jgi:hypothetical protein
MQDFFKASRPAYYYPTCTGGYFRGGEADNKPPSPELEKSEAIPTLHNIRVSSRRNAYLVKHREKFIFV